MLEPLDPFGFRLAGVGAAIGGGQHHRIGERGEQGARVEPIHPHHVELRAQHQGDRDQVEEREQPEDQCENGVGGTGRTDRPRDVAGAEPLQELPDQRPDEGTWQHLAIGQLPARRRSERHQQDAGVDRDGHHRNAGRAEHAEIVDGPPDGGQHGRRDRRRAEHQQEQQAANARPDRIRADVAGHRPDRVHRVLDRLPDAGPAVEGAQDADHHGDCATAELLGLCQLLTDERELADGRLHDLLLQIRSADEDHTQGGGQQEQHREQRDERVVGDQRREVTALVVDVLVDHRDDVAHDAAALLQPVEPTDHPSHLSRSAPGIPPPTGGNTRGVREPPSRRSAARLPRWPIGRCR